MNKKISSNIALILARKGSKGLPGKNKKIFLGKPLIYWTIKNAIQSKIFSKVVVSTDCEEIASLSMTYGASVPFLRPEYLSQDESNSIDAVLHALRFFEEYHNLIFKYTTLLEPTSPLREKDDLKNMYSILLKFEKKFDAIISLGEMPYHPIFSKKLLDNNKITPYFGKNIECRRQELEKALFPFGVAYMCKTNILKKDLSFYPENSTGYLIKPYQCVEIDTEVDFICAEALGKNFLKK